MIGKRFSRLLNFNDKCHNCYIQFIRKFVVEIKENN